MKEYKITMPGSYILIHNIQQIDILPNKTNIETGKPYTEIIFKDPQGNKYTLAAFSNTGDTQHITKHN